MFVVPTLAEEVLIRMRAPPDPSDAAFQGVEEDSADEDERTGAPVGAFPGTATEYHSGNTSYY